MRILIFGPNGSGKGTQSALLVKRYGFAHVESGGIFRDQIKRGTELGVQAKAYTDKGALVPDSITIPMILERLAEDDCKSGWILDGFPRNPSQANALTKGLEEADTPLDAVIIIEVAKQTAKNRLMGRRNCPEGHANNVAIEAIAPKGEGDDLVCWKCGSPVTARKDDVDEEAIDLRLNIYFDEENGTLGSVDAVEKWAAGKPEVKIIKVNGEGPIDEIRAMIESSLDA